MLLPPQSPLLPLTASLLLLLLFPILSGFPPGVCTLVLGITPALVQLASWVKAAASLIVSYDSTFLAEPQVQHLMFRWRLPDELLLLGLMHCRATQTASSSRSFSSTIAWQVLKNLQYKPQTYASLLHERPVRSPGPCRRARWFPQKSLGFIGLGFRAYRDIGFRV